MNAFLSRQGKAAGWPVRAGLWASALCLTLSLCTWGSMRQLEICALGAAACLGWLFGKGRLAERLLALCSLPSAIAAGVSALSIWPLLSWTQPKRYTLVRWFVGERLAQPQWAQALCVIIGLMLIPALYVYLCGFFGWLGHALGRVIGRMTRGDRVLGAVGLALCTVLIVSLFLQSNAFYGAPVDGDSIDILYTSDSGYLYQQNVYIHIDAGENDIRQPLFGVFSLPLSAPLWQLSRLLPYPAYPLMMAVMQGALLLVCIALLSQLLGLTGAARRALAFCTAALYPTLLFTLMQEQYVFEMLWLLLLVDAHLSGGEGRDWLFCAAAGSMLTSAAFWPLCADWKDARETVRQLARALGAFVAMWFVFGRFGGLLNVTGSLRWLLDNFVRADGPAEVPLTLLDKLRQYSWFVRSCFAAPETVLESARHGYVTWQQAAVTGFSAAGIVLFGLSAAGFWLNRRQRLAQIAGAWALFSLVLLGVVGYGAKENGMVLYTLYFGWAFVSLLVLGLKKLFSPRVCAVLLAAAGVTLLLLNLPAMAELCRFAIENYPVAVIRVS